MLGDLDFSAFEQRYRDKQYIGAGGFGKVYKVFDHAKNHYVALKVADVRPEISKFTLMNEVELVNKLPQHRNIARYDACYRYNTGFTGEMDFALLKFYEDGNLDQFLKRESISESDKHIIIKGIIDGIDFLHGNDVIHRDLKAENILLQREDGVWTPKITDFGLSRKMNDSQSIVNSAIGLSYAYAAPEQIQNKKITKNVDIWALGVIIYRVLADELPFRGNKAGSDRSTQSQLELSRKIVNLELPDKLNTIPEPYQQVIRRCLVLDPMERAQTAKELSDLLKGTNNAPSQATSNQPPVGYVPPPEETHTQILAPPAAEQAPPPSEAKPPQPVAPPPGSVVDDPLGSQLDAEPNPSHEWTPPIDLGLDDSESSDAYDDTLDVEAPDPSGNEVKILHEPEPEPEKEKLVTSFQPKMGDAPRSSKKGLWIALGVVAVIGLSIGGYFMFSGSSDSQASTDPKPQKEVDDSTNGSTAAPAAVAYERFEDLESQIQAAGGDEATADDIKSLIQKEIDAPGNAKNYRPQFLMALHCGYLEEMRSVRKYLDASMKVAVYTKQQSADMLSDMEKHENDGFSSFTEAVGGKDGQTINFWDEFKEILGKTGSK